MYVSSCIEIIDPYGLCLCLWPCWEAQAVQTRAAAALATRPVMTPVHGISKNNSPSGHIPPNYAASLKYAFSVQISAGIIRQTLTEGRWNHVCLISSATAGPMALVHYL